MSVSRILTGKSVGEKEDIDEAAKKAVSDYLRRSSITFLECAIHLMMESMSYAEVIKVLRAEADMLEELV